MIDSIDLELWLNRQNTSVRLLIYISIFFLILVPGWTIWIDPLLEEHTQNLRKIAKLKKQLHRYSPIRYKQIEISAQNSLKKLDQQISQLTSRLQNINAHARKFSYLWFDTQQFTAFLQAILSKSLDLNLRIDKINKISTKISKSSQEAKNYEDNFLIVPKLLLQKIVIIEGAGNFPDIIRLIYFIESFNFLIKTERLLIKKSEVGKKNHFQIQLKFYGL